MQSVRSSPNYLQVHQSNNSNIIGIRWIANNPLQQCNQQDAHPVSSQLHHHHVIGVVVCDNISEASVEQLRHSIINQLQVPRSFRFLTRKG